MTVFSISFPLRSPPVFLPHCFCHIFVPFLPKWEYLSSSDVFSLSHPSHSSWQFSPEVTKAVHQAVYLPSVECKTCAVKRSSAYEILFRTDCGFCKSLYLVKIHVCSFGKNQTKPKQKTNHYLWKAESYPNWKTKQQLSVRKAGWINFTACAVAFSSSLLFSLSDP